MIETTAVAMRRSVARKHMFSWRMPWSLWLVVSLGLLAVIGPFSMPFGPYVQHTGPGQALQPPSVVHPFGTDQLGRDILSRVVYGARVSLGVGIASVFIAALAGTLFGMLAGFGLGWFDHVIMRVMDALSTFPAMILTIAITSVIGVGLIGVTIAIGIVNIPVFARLARARVLQVKTREFVDAAYALGARRSRILIRHVLPNIAGPLIVQASVIFSFAILVEASLSFLGLGVQPPTPSWGTMINEGKQFKALAPWMIFAPGAAIFMSVMTFNFFGDAMRDNLDPASRGPI